MTTSQKNLKIYVILGSRATYYRQQVLFDKMEADSTLEVIYFVTGDLLKPEYANTYDTIKTSYKNVLSIHCDYDNTFDTLGSASIQIMDMLYNYIYEYKPGKRICLSIADRWEQLPLAFLCFMMNIPIVHIQGGEVSGNIDNSIRHCLSNMAKLHFPTNQNAFKALKMARHSSIYNYGCPSIDLIKLVDYKAITGLIEHFICIFHPLTDELDEIKKQNEILYQAIIKFTEETNIKCYWFRQNNDPGSNDIVVQHNENIEFINNLTGTEFIKLLASSKFIIGNSSAGIRESCFLGIPSIIIGNRQKNRAHGPNVIYKIPIIKKQLSIALSNILKVKVMPSKFFGDGNSSVKILKKIKEVYK